MLEDWGLDDSRSWRPGYLRPGKRTWEIQVSARGKGRRSGGRSAGKGGKGERAGNRRRERGEGERARHRRQGAAAHGIRVQGARRWSFLPNGVFVVSRSIGASVDVVSY